MVFGQPNVAYETERSGRASSCKFEDSRAGTIPHDSLEANRIRKRQAAETLALASDGVLPGRRAVRPLYADRDKATQFAVRQKKSPVVKMARVTEVN